MGAVLFQASDFHFHCKANMAPSALTYPHYLCIQRERERERDRETERETETERDRERERIKMYRGSVVEKLVFLPYRNKWGLWKIV